jgi:spore coat protein U-like protein
MTKRLIMAMGVLILVLAVSGIAVAGSSATSFGLQTNAIADCKITTPATNIDFGSYDPTVTNNNDNGTGGFGFKCTKGTAYKVYITGTRAMTSGAETLNFELYADAGRTSVFPNINAAGIAGSATSNAVEIITNIYGRIPAGQDVTAGKTFNQTLTVTVDY